MLLLKYLQGTMTVEILLEQKVTEAEMNEFWFYTLGNNSLKYG